MLFVATTDDLPSTDYAGETARVNSLGADDALLLVAIDDRTDAIWVSDALPVSDAELDAIVSDRLEPALRDGDFAGAAIATAEGLGAATQPATPGPVVTNPPKATELPDTPGGGSTGGGIGLATLVGLILLGLGIVVVIMWGVGRIAAWRETGERSRRNANLAREANAKLIAADDRIRTADQETGFVEAEFGESEAAPFRAAVAEARSELRAAFALRQRLDDSDPEDPPTREAMLNQILEASQRANALLDAQSGRIDELRSLQRDAPKILAGLPMQIEAVERRLPGAESSLAGFASFAKAAWSSVDGNAEEARKGLAGARAAVDRGMAAVTSNRSTAVREIVTAQKGIAGAATLLDAVDKLEVTLREAAATVAPDLEAARRDLDDARMALAGPDDPSPAERDHQLAGASSSLAEAEAVAAARPSDPIASAKLAATARRGAAELRASVRRDAEQAARFAAALEASIGAARAEVDRAAAFIAPRSNGVRRQARTRLSEAERLLERALELRESDPKAAMEHAQRADTLAGEAYSLASMDFTRWDAGRGGASRGSTGADVAGAILGGIIGGMLGGGGRGGGWGGSSWGSPGSSNGPFGGGGGGGGWGGGGNSSGGGFGGFGGGGGGGGGHARGGRW